MSIRFALLATTALAASACSGGSDTIDKGTARSQVAKGDTSTDLCEELGWYGDGVCDDFCLSPDPDCDGSQYCYSDTDCGEDQACNAGEVCLSPCGDSEGGCIAVCAGFCVPGDTDVEPDECWGAWIDETGSCRAANDGALPDECCDGIECNSNQACRDDEFCDFDLIADAASCGIDDVPGTCRPRPEACIEIYSPVCGCDAETYSTECHANSEGVSMSFQGECETPTAD